MTKQFYFFWGDAYPEPDPYASRCRTIQFVSEDNGFTQADFDAVAALEVGRAYTADNGMAGEHVTIVRAR